MSKIGLWDTNAAGNNAATPDGWPEGQAPSTLNNCGREVMAAVKTALQDMEWFDHGFSPTWINANSFSIPGNQTDQILAGRKLKLYDATTIYRSVATASFTVVTTISLGAGTAITNSLSSFAAAILKPTNQSFPDRMSLSALEVTNISASTMQITGNLGVAGALSASAVSTPNFGITGRLSASAANVSSSLSVGALTVIGNASVAGYLSASAGQVTGVFSASTIQATGNVGVAGKISASAMAITGILTASAMSVTGTLTASAIVATTSLNFYPWAKFSASVGGVVLQASYGISAASRVSTGQYRLVLKAGYNASAASILVSNNHLVGVASIWVLAAYGSANAVIVARTDISNVGNDGIADGNGIGVVVIL